MADSAFCSLAAAAVTPFTVAGSIVSTALLSAFATALAVSAAAVAEALAVCSFCCNCRSCSSAAIARASPSAVASLNAASTRCISRAARARASALTAATWEEAPNKEGRLLVDDGAPLGRQLLKHPESPRPDDEGRPNAVCALLRL